MVEKDPNLPGDGKETPEIVVNEYGSTRDSAVVVEEVDRTVLLTNSETIIVEKEPAIDIPPANRPRKVYGGMWGQTEIAAVGLASLLVLAAILFYVFKVVPSENDLTRHRSERNRLESELASAKSKYGNISSTQTQVDKLVSSVSDFEMNYLPAATNGRIALYQRLNGLIASYGLVNTSGPDYAPLDAPDQGQNNQSDAERGRAKFRSLFPGMYVTMTVEGSYPNLRRFIREIEAGREFVIVSSVELQPSDTEKQNRQPNQPATAGNPAIQPVGVNPAYQVPGGPISVPQQNQPLKGRTRGEVVSLRLEMAAYFRRPDFTAPEPVEGIK